MVFVVIALWTFYFAVCQEYFDTTFSPNELLVENVVEVQQWENHPPRERTPKRIPTFSLETISGIFEENSTFHHHHLPPILTQGDDESAGHHDRCDPQLPPPIPAVHAVQLHGFHQGDLSTQLFLSRSSGRTQEKRKLWGRGQQWTTASDGEDDDESFDK